MSTLASQSVSLHAMPVGGSDMPGRPQGSYVTATSLTNEANFSGQSQEWHVVGSNGVMARQNNHQDSDAVALLPFACLLTVTDKQGGMVKISSPVVGWVPVADNVGYVLLAKGGASAGTKWRYRVVCRDGAFVRHGIELTSPFLFNLPWHSVVEVLERRINEAGLPRLKIAEGWISEVLNPLSGQRGPVVEIVRLLQPLLYRVVLADGAVVRRTVELASGQVKTLAYGDVVQVSAKQFSDLGNRCVQRLKLSDGSGWLSMRLNKEPPDDSAVVEYAGLGEDNHSASVVPLPRLAGTSMSREYFARTLSGSGGGGDAGAGGNAGREASAPTAPAGKEMEGTNEEDEDLRKIKNAGELGEDDNCVVCLSGPRTATIVHGEIGHIACCLECARILKARGDTCPVCRVPIDSVVQHFWA
ncbi:unnamed protein product [Hapterophycus canaliculatus]